MNSDSFASCFTSQNNIYFQKYLRLVQFRKNNTINVGYIERHHIVPRCYYKFHNLKIDNSENNIVSLTFLEHIQAHNLLRKYFYSVHNKQMYFAMQKALSIIFQQQNLQHYNLTLDEILKSKKILKIFNRLKTERIHQKGKDSPTYDSVKIYNVKTGKIIQVDRAQAQKYLSTDEWKYGTNLMHITNIKTGKNTIISKSKPIPDGWIAGRTIKKLKPTEKIPYTRKYLIDGVELTLYKASVKYKIPLRLLCSRVLKHKIPITLAIKQQIKQQAVSRKDQLNIQLTYNGNTKTIYEWSSLTNIDPHTIYVRYLKHWPIEKILTYHKTYKYDTIYEYQSIKRTIREWAKQYNISATNLYARLILCKWNFEKAVNTPVRKRTYYGKSKRSS